MSSECTRKRKDMSSADPGIVVLLFTSWQSTTLGDVVWWHHLKHPKYLSNRLLSTKINNPVLFQVRTYDDQSFMLTWATNARRKLVISDYFGFQPHELSHKPSYEYDMMPGLTSTVEGNVWLLVRSEVVERNSAMPQEKRNPPPCQLVVLSSLPIGGWN